jgi:hypothetical protein
LRLIQNSLPVLNLTSDATGKWISYVQTKVLATGAEARGCAAELRVRRQRPYHSRAPDQRDELASLQLIELHPVTARLG